MKFLKISHLRFNKCDVTATVNIYLHESQTIDFRLLLILANVMRTKLGPPISSLQQMAIWHETIQYDMAI